MFPAGQTVPQAPQFSLSEGRWTQSPAHSVRPPWQSRTHWPFWQASPAAQAWPQVPQLAPSVWRSAQVPSQTAEPDPQLAPPAPASGCPAPWMVTAESSPVLHPAIRVKATRKRSASARSVA